LEGETVNRVMVYLAALAGTGGVIFLAQAQQPAAAPAPTAAPKPTTGRVAVFNVAKVMREYQRWQYFAAIMNNKRATAAGELAKLQNEIATLREQAQRETLKPKQEELIAKGRAKMRDFEDAERKAKGTLDEESQSHLKNLFAEIQSAVKAIVDANGYDMVMAYPDAMTDEERNSPMYFDMKMRPQAAMPFYVSPSIDISPVLLATLNKHYPAPGPIPAMIAPPVQQTDGRVPAPGQGQ
jgi:Skp family chaperone for outer membrane proteins